MHTILTILITTIIITVIVSITYIKAGKWFQKAKLGSLILASEECKSIEELQGIVNEAEELKLKMLGNEQIENVYYLKTNDALYSDQGFIDTSEMSLGQLLKHFSNKQEQLKNSNVIKLFDES